MPKIHELLFSKQMTVVDRALNMCNFFFWGGGVQININRYKSSWTITSILIHILKTAAMMTTGDLAQMVGASMNDVTMELKQLFYSYFLFCFVLFLFVCLVFVSVFFVCLFVCFLFVFCFLFVCLFFFWRFPFRYRSLYRDRFFNLNHGLIICFSFLLLMDRLRIV